MRSHLRSSKGGVPSRVLGWELRQLWREGGTPEPRGGDGRAGVCVGAQSSGPGSDGGKQRIRQPRRPSGEDGETQSTTLASREAETAREVNGTEKWSQEREYILDHQQSEKATTSWSVKSSRLQEAFLWTKGFPGRASGKEPTCQCWRPERCGFNSWVGMIPSRRVWHEYPLQYSCLENPMDRGAWWATVYRVTKGRKWLKWLSTHACMHYEQSWWRWYN